MSSCFFNCYAALCPSTERMSYQKRSHGWCRLVTAHDFRSASVGAGKSAWVRDWPEKRAWASFQTFQRKQSMNLIEGPIGTSPHHISPNDRMMSLHDQLSRFSHHSATGPGTSFPAMPTSCSLGFAAALLATKGSTVAHAKSWQACFNYLQLTVSTEAKQHQVLPEVGRSHTCRLRQQRWKWWGLEISMRLRFT